MAYNVGEGGRENKKQKKKRKKRTRAFSLTFDSHFQKKNLALSAASVELGRKLGGKLGLSSGLGDRAHRAEIVDDILCLAKVDFLERAAHLDLELLDQATDVGNVLARVVEWCILGLDLCEDMSIPRKEKKDKQILPDASSNPRGSSRRGPVCSSSCRGGPST